MSENLDLVRSIWAAWERGDFSNADWAHPEIEWTTIEGVAPGHWKGIAAIAEGFRPFLSAWKGFRVVADEYRELDHERVLVLVQFHGQGKTSELEMGQMRSQGATLFHVSDGKVIRAVLYFDRQRALTDLGLKE
jgi:ketosteroid isomerase-like protein